MLDTTGLNRGGIGDGGGIGMTSLVGAVTIIGVKHTRQFLDFLEIQKGLHAFNRHESIRELLGRDMGINTIKSARNYIFVLWIQRNAECKHLEEKRTTLKENGSIETGLRMMAKYACECGSIDF